MNKKPRNHRPCRFIAVRKWRDGGEQTVEYFETEREALGWIQRQPQPVEDEFIWCVGEYGELS